MVTSVEEVRVSPEIQESLPKYLQIANYFRERILQGELRPGEELPSERRIVEEWRVSRPTASRALAALRVDGLVESRQGSGTFVRSQPRLYRRARDRYARSRATGRMYTPGEWSEITLAEWAQADEQVAAGLGVEQGARVVRRRRVIYDQAGPVEVSTSWFAAVVGKRAPRLLDRTRIIEGTLVYVEKATGRRGAMARDRLSARLATPEESAALRLGSEVAAVLVVHHTAFDSEGDPIEFAEAVYPSGRWSFEEEYPI